MPFAHVRKYLLHKLIHYLESRICFQAAQEGGRINEPLRETPNPIGQPLKIICKFFVLNYTFIQNKIDDYIAKTIKNAFFRCHQHSTRLAIFGRIREQAILVQKFPLRTLQFPDFGGGLFARKFCLLKGDQKIMIPSVNISI